MTINTSSLGGGGALPKLAPDLTAPTRWGGLNPRTTITGLNSGGVIITALSITGGAGYITNAFFENLTVGSQTIKLTIDGVIIFNDVWTTTNATPVLIGGISSGTFFYDPVPWRDSFLLEITTADTAFDLQYVYRKTL